MEIQPKVSFTEDLLEQLNRYLVIDGSIVYDRAEYEEDLREQSNDDRIYTIYQSIYDSYKDVHGYQFPPAFSFNGYELCVIDFDDRKPLLVKGFESADHIKNVLQTVLPSLEWELEEVKVNTSHFLNTFKFIAAYQVCLKPCTRYGKDSLEFVSTLGGVIETKTVKLVLPESWNLSSWIAPYNVTTIINPNSYDRTIKVLSTVSNEDAADLARKHIPVFEEAVKQEKERKEAEAKKALEEKVRLYEETKSQNKIDLIMETVLSLTPEEREEVYIQLRELQS